MLVQKIPFCQIFSYFFSSNKMNDGYIVQNYDLIIDPLFIISVRTSNIRAMQDNEHNDFSIANKLLSGMQPRYMSYTNNLSCLIEHLTTGGGLETLYKQTYDITCIMKDHQTFVL